MSTGQRGIYENPSEMVSHTREICLVLDVGELLYLSYLNKREMTVMIVSALGNISQTLASIS